MLFSIGSIFEGYIQYCDISQVTANYVLQTTTNTHVLLSPEHVG